MPVGVEATKFCDGLLCTIENWHFDIIKKETVVKNGFRKFWNLVA